MVTDLRFQAGDDPSGQAGAGQAPAATLLFQFAAHLAQAGKARESAEMFRRAYLLQPSVGPLLRKDMLEGEGARLRDYAAGLIRNGVTFSAVIAALAVAEALQGDEAEVRRLVDYDRFFKGEIMDPPEGWDHASFNRDLAAEIRTDLHYYDEPPRRAIRRAWRQEQVMESPLPALRSWAGNIRAIVERYMRSAPAGLDHPFASARPSDYGIEAWALVSDGDSFHHPHIHPRAWMSGVYYVTCPPAARAPGSRRGWLHIGPPEKYGVSADQGWAERMFAPEPGALVMMPAYFYHWTHPMGCDEERICLVFDVVPVELGSQGSAETDY